jgi:hypothetical protein
MDKFALREIYMELYPGAAIEQTEQGFGNILKIIENEISLKATSQNNIRISYYGSDVKKGEKLVDFYSKRLCRKTGEGFKRHALQASDSKSSTDTAKDENKSGAVKLTGSITIKENKAILRTDRISPAIKILVLSFIVIFVFIGFLECIDPSFKSERQVSRYLGLPTLGSLPDLNKISKIE